MKKVDPEQFGGGRKSPPYTIPGIERLMCSRRGCGRRAHATWAGCADGNIFRPLCPECDVELNRVAMEWWGDPEWEPKIVEYANSVSEDIGRVLQLDWLVPPDG